MRGNLLGKMQWGFPLACLIFCGTGFWGTLAFAQGCWAEAPQPKTDNPINVNWFYGSYVPKEVPLEPLNAERSFELYLRRTYSTRGIYIKTALFALSDQMQNAYPQWGNGFNGFGKRIGTRQAEFILQNSLVSLGSGLLGWEPRYDRCRCTGFWPRTRHAMVRSFVTYDGTEQNRRPQFLPYLGAFAASAIATTWEPGKPQWHVKGYQAVFIQFPFGIGSNWIGEFAPEIGRVLKQRKIH